MAEINYIAILVAAIASFAVGWAWHGLCGKTWMKLSGMTKEKLKSMKMSPAQSMTIAFVVTLLTAYVVSHFVGLLGISTFGSAAQFAFWAWLGLIGPVQLGVWLWEGKPFGLFLFNGAYQLVNLIVISGIVAVWH